MDIQTIMTLVTIFVTYFCGVIAKKIQSSIIS